MANRSHLRICLAFALVGVLAGCATTSHDASREDAYGVRHIPLALGQTSTGGTLLQHPMPAYPPEWLAERMAPRDIVARLGVDADGHVSSVSIDDDASPDLVHQRLAAVVREAALRWTFAPLQTHPWAADASGEASDTGSQVQPFRVSYLFHFAWNGEAPTVSYRQVDGT